MGPFLILSYIPGLAASREARMTDLPELRPIEGYEDFYAIARDGRVYAYDRQTYFKDGRPSRLYPARWMAIRQHSVTKYLDVGLRLPNGSQKRHLVHRLVAVAYVPNPNDLPEVNHKDNDPSNPNDWNLEWRTAQGNKSHSMTTGKATNKTGYFGVSVCKDTHVARVHFQGKRKAIGYRKDPAAAARLYDAFVRQYNLDLPLNFPD